jgi:hypothetical protein
VCLKCSNLGLARRRRRRRWRLEVLHVLDVVVWSADGALQVTMHRAAHRAAQQNACWSNLLRTSCVTWLVQLTAHYHSVACLLALSGAWTPSECSCCSCAALSSHLRQVLADDACAERGIEWMRGSWAHGAPAPNLRPWRVDVCYHRLVSMPLLHGALMCCVCKCNAHTSKHRHLHACFRSN